MQKGKKCSTSFVLMKLLGYTKVNKILVFACLLFSFLNMFINIMEAYIVQNLINAALNNKYKLIQSNIILMAIVMVVGVIVVYLLRYLYGMFSNKAIKDFRQNVFAFVQRLPVAFMEKNHSGDLLSRLTADISIVQGFFSNDLFEIFLQLITFIGAFIYMAFINVKLLLFSIMLSPIALILLNIIGNHVKNFTKEQQKYFAKANSITKDAIGGVPIIKAFNIEKEIFNKYEIEVNCALKYSLKVVRLNSLMAPMNVVLRLVPTVMCIAYGGYLSVIGQMTPGELMSFLYLLGFVSGPLAYASNLVNNTKKTIGAAERLAEILEEELECDSAQDSTKKLDEIAIDFCNVSFSYDGKRKAINDLSFSIKKGKKVALVGMSGSGKTTVFKLLCGFYKIKNGHIKVSGRDINEWGLKELRNQLSLVSQDTFLFPVSVFDNISFGRLGASREQIIQAAKDANAHDFITELDAGYETLVGERSIKLSGGQRQRIALARAILKKSSIVLLDEPTSALDTQSEAIIQDALHRTMSDSTVLIIAHRLSTIKEVDEVLVMDNGSVVERGTHEELMNNDGIYKQLYLKQFFIQDIGSVEKAV